MNKFITILLVFSMTLAIGQGCTTFLTTHLGIEVLQSSQQASGLNFCKSIKTANTCCDASIVNSFETKATELLARLTTSVSNRDKFIIRARKSAFGLRSALTRIQAASEKAAENLKNYTPVSSSNSGSGEVTMDASSIVLMASGFGEIATTLTGNITDLIGSFDDFQTKRKECVVQLVNLQTAAWCLACDPDQTNNGVGANSLELDAATSQKVVDACGPFIVLSAAQNAFIAIHYMSGMLNGMASALEKMAANDIEGGMNDFVMALFSMLSGGAVTEPSSVDETASTLPDGCTETSCSWIFSSLFVNGKIDEELLAAGGKIEETSSSSGGFTFNRLLFGKRHDDEEEVVVKKIVDRKLTGSWGPDDDESGITISFETNPGGVENNSDSLSGLRNAVVGLSMAVLAVLFF